MTKHTASCHCGKMKIDFNMDKNEQAISCNCSICKRRGSLLIFRAEGDVTPTMNKSAVGDYQFAKKTIHHLFCQNCGVSPWAESISPEGKKNYAININCISDFNTEQVAVKKFDGAKL